VMSECGCSESDPSCGCWSSSSSRSVASTELKLYRAFIFCVPIFFTLILLFLFYLFYLRPRTRLHWISHFRLPSNNNRNNAISTLGLGLNKELREMLPIIVYKESFSVKDTQSVIHSFSFPFFRIFNTTPSCPEASVIAGLTSHTTTNRIGFDIILEFGLDPNSAHEMRVVAHLYTLV